MAFAVSGYVPVGIAVVDADGCNGRHVYKAPSPTSGPSWSSDGTRLVFETQAHLEILNVDGSNPTNLTGVWGSGYNPDWSPQGGKIAYVRKGGDVLGLYVINDDGSNAVKLTSLEASIGRSSWSPDGSKIAYESGGKIKS